MTAAQARTFFLKTESYCNFDLPGYIQFGSLLEAVAEQMRGKELRAMSLNPREHEGVNYTVQSNKDGRYAWRPLQLIHPALYVSLVDKITTPENWGAITRRFIDFQKSCKLRCLGIPLQSRAGGKDKAALIGSWWQEIEQRSIELAIEYGHLFHADIKGCYAAIYTHSIAWALHGKNEAKSARRNKELIGNAIDAQIQGMRQGQTNGIPQGSVLMDFIAEMVLGHADLDLTTRIGAAGISDYHILRYRDDYRVFTNNPRDGEQILKLLTEVLIGLGMQLNTAKTGGSSQVVKSSVKADKRSWIRGKQWDRNLQKHLLIIHAHAEDFPNSGSVVVALGRFHKRVYEEKAFQNVRALISIVVDIAYGSPRAFPVCAAIISKLLTAIKEKAEREEIVGNAHTKMSQMPNTGHIELWLQRISYASGLGVAYGEPICKLVEGEATGLWNSDWIKDENLKAALNPSGIVSRPRLRAAKPVIAPEEIAVFPEERYE